MSTRNNRNMYDQCKELMLYHVVLTMSDGKKYNGIIEDLNDSEVTVLIGEDIKADDYKMKCQYNRQPYPMRYRRFGRRRFPLSGLVGLGLFGYPYFGGYYPPLYPPFYPY